MRPSQNSNTLQTAFSTRQYMLSKDFEVYYYSDIKKNSVAAHTHDYYEFYFFLEGKVEINIAGVAQPVAPGDFLIIPPGTTHYPVFLDENTPYRRFILWISRSYCNLLLQASKDYAYLLQYVETTHHYRYSNDLITFHTLESMIFELISETKGTRFGKEAKVSLLVNSLLLHLNRLVYERNHTAVATGNELYIAISRYIDEHLAEDLSLWQLENAFFVSKYYISHTFKDHMGVSLHQYITKKRLYACRDALICSDSVTKVYERFGFNDYSNFFRAFKKEFGISPKDYKELYPSLNIPGITDKIDRMKVEKNGIK